jgi:quercetin dioxygenase-like cupin family protein
MHGAVDVETADGSHRLEAGDAILFEADAPHAYRNPGAEEAVITLVITYSGSVLP